MFRGTWDFSPDPYLRLASCDCVGNFIVPVDFVLSITPLCCPLRNVFILQAFGNFRAAQAEHAARPLAPLASHPGRSKVKGGSSLRRGVTHPGPSFRESFRSNGSFPVPRSTACICFAQGSMKLSHGI